MLAKQLESNLTSEFSTAESEIDRTGSRERPRGETPVGFQKWQQLLFVHWRIDPTLMRKLVPQPLSIDTFDNSAWLGLVPFYMADIRRGRLPAVPWISNFCETNLRTYVHFKGQPGVYFFSLEASRLIAVALARTNWNLNYFWARMRLEREQDSIAYHSRRFTKTEPAMAQIRAKVGETIADADQRLALGTLEDFLAERYLLFVKDRKQRLLSGQVHHTPYPLKKASILQFDETIASAAGFDVGAPDHVLFSEGVSTEIFGLKQVWAPNQNE